MGIKIINLGIKREIGLRVVYYFKPDNDGFLCLWRNKLDGKKGNKKFILKTNVKKDGNMLSWYYVKTAEDGTLDMWRTNRNFVPPGVSWGKAKKTLKKETEENKKYKSINLKMTDGVLDATFKHRTKEGVFERKVTME